VFAAEHLLRLAGVDPGAQIVERAREVLLDGLPCLGPLDEHGKVVGTLLQLAREIAILFEAAAALQDLLRAGLVLPEVRRGDLRFYSRELFGGVCGVKDSSAGRRRGAPGPRTCEAGRPVEWS
jgi:hypothetical protein